MQNTNESFWVETKDGRYFCCSPQTGFYFSDDTNDPNIVDGAELEIKYEKEDTILQIAEQVKMKKGTQFSRKDLFQHPEEKAWLACEKKVVRVLEDKTKVREYVPYWSRKFKSVVCISKTREKCQGNAAWRTGSKSVKEANAKAQMEKKKRLASAQETARKLNFDPMKRLALYAMGDSQGLGLNEEVKQSIQLKSLEVYLKYTHQQMRPFSPDEAAKLKEQNSGPKINVILPADGSEDTKHVLQHKDENALSEYLAKGSSSAYDDYSEDIYTEGTDEGFDYTTARVELPSEEDGEL